MFIYENMLRYSPGDSQGSGSYGFYVTEVSIFLSRIMT